MKISEIRCTPFSIPLKTPIKFARGTLATTDHVLVEIRTDAGLVGIAEAPSRPFFYGESQKSIVAAIEDWFAPALVGTDPVDIEGAWARFGSVEHNNTAKGALDLALHDVVGQAAGLSLVRLLGGTEAPVRVTYVCGFGKPEAMADEAASINAEQGISAFKLKAGLDPKSDAAMFEALRACLPDALLYIDCNQGLRASEAIRLLSIAADFGVAWAEEPCHVDDRIGRKGVAASRRLPILGDESCRTPAEVAREISDGTIDLVSIKVARTGYRNSRRILGLATANRVRPLVGSQGDSGIGVAAGAHFCAAFGETRAVPAELSFHLNLADDLLVEPLGIKDGYLTLPDRPGLGVSVDPDRLKRLRI
jgi:L-Ala-D/L-Glu epimerase / N-acetyl-D-glutamate racemase